ncbi:MAG: hypothetical protein A4E42_01143 [Methanoregulaceae archaeon PtaU1.Bin222]|nr:MAG: hypothetical protein A4E42_01143 [Methanoregulaceae archaeon PtaU1.Bin222]
MGIPNPLHEFVESFTTQSDCWNDGDSKFGLQSLPVDGDPHVTCLIPHIQSKYDRFFPLKDLEREIQVPLEIRGISNIDDEISTLQQLKRNFFCPVGWLKRIGSRGINDLVAILPPA